MGDQLNTRQAFLDELTLALLQFLLPELTAIVVGYDTTEEGSKFTVDELKRLGNEILYKPSLNGTWVLQIHSTPSQWGEDQVCYTWFRTDNLKAKHSLPILDFWTCAATGGETGCDQVEWKADNVLVFTQACGWWPWGEGAPERGQDLAVFVDTDPLRWIPYSSGDSSE